jgi:hypothetical protein
VRDTPIPLTGLLESGSPRTDRWAPAVELPLRPRRGADVPFGGHDHDLDLTHIVLLASLGQLQSLSASANRVGVYQPAASHALAWLGRQLGDPLFARMPTGLRATPFGESHSHAPKAVLDTLRIGPTAAPAR